MLKKLIRITPIVFLLPVVAWAQITNFQALVATIADVIEALIPVLIGLAILAFFWGLVRFVFAAGDEEARERGKKIMIWGIIAIFIMIALWGIINFLLDTFGLDPARRQAPTAPTVPAI
jgi:hypothetical protein